MANLGELLVALGLDTGEYSEGLDDAESQTEEFSSKGEAAFGKIATAALGLGTVVAGLGISIGAAAFDFAQQTNQSVNDIQAGLGVTADEAQRLGDVATDVFANNWGNSLDEVTAALVETERQFSGLGGIADDQASKIVESAFAIRDTFGVDVNEAISAQRTLMEQFGLTSQEAADFVTKGFQEGLNSSDDFLDTIGEYSNLFADGGASAENFFSVMETGLGSGVLGTDKAADAFKEFGIRIKDGSDSTNAALVQLGDSIEDNLTEQLGPDASKFEIFDAFSTKMQGMGLDVEEFRGAFESGVTDIDTTFRSAVLKALDDGSLTAAQAFSLIQSELRNVDGEMSQTAIGVGLFGTQFEDLGNDMALAMDMGTTKLSDLAGSTDTLNAKYNNLGSVWEGMKRQFLVAIAPIGEKLLEVANTIMPVVQTGFNWLKDNLPGIIDNVVISIDGFVSAVGEIITAIQPVVDFIVANMTPILAGLAAVLVAVVVPAFIAWATTASTAAMATITALAPVIAPIIAIGAAVAVLVAAWENDWGGIRTTLTDFWNNTGKPIFDVVKTWLEDKLTAALTILASFWTDVLKPALSAVWDFITTSVIPLFNRLVNNTFKGVNTGVSTLSDFWTNTLKPALNAVWSFIDRNIKPIFDSLVKLEIAALKLAVVALATLWTDVLKPALDAVWRFIDRNVIPIFKTLFNEKIKEGKTALQELADFWTDVLKPALDAVVKFIDTTVISAFNNWISKGIDPVKSALSSIKDVIDSVTGWIDDLIKKLDAIEVPNPLAQHSPSLIEKAILDVGIAAQMTTADTAQLSRSLNAVRAPDVNNTNNENKSQNVYNVDARGSTMTSDQMRAVILQTIREVDQNRVTSQRYR